MFFFDFSDFLDQTKQQSTCFLCYLGFLDNKSSKVQTSAGENGSSVAVLKDTVDDSLPGHCTCKECPECVTRFLEDYVPSD